MTSRKNRTLLIAAGFVVICVSLFDAGLAVAGRSLIPAVRSAVLLLAGSGVLAASLKSDPKDS